MNKNKLSIILVMLCITLFTYNVQTFFKIQTRQIFYTSAQTDNILSSYYDISDVDLLLNDLSIIKSNTGHTHVLSGLTDVTISLIQNNDALIYKFILYFVRVLST